MRNNYIVLEKTECEKMRKPLLLYEMLTDNIWG